MLYSYGVGFSEQKFSGIRLSIIFMVKSLLLVNILWVLIYCLINFSREIFSVDLEVTNP